MKKAFTLIELMITILIMTVFLNFVFKFYSNVLIELRYLEAKDSLTYNGFRALQIIRNGVHGNNDYIGGIVTLKNIGTDNNFTTNDNTSSMIKIDIADNNLIIIDGSNSYIFRGIDIESNNFSISEVANDLYAIEFNATKESLLTFSNLNRTNITTFQRLVYTK